MSKKPKAVDKHWWIAASALGTAYLAVDMYAKGRLMMAAFNVAASLCLLGFAAWTLSRTKS